MVHRDDVVGIISYVIDHDIRGTFNVSEMIIQLEKNLLKQFVKS